MPAQQQSEADLVASFLANGGEVTKCPTGKSALALEYEWVDGKGLIAKDREKAKQAFRHSVGSSFASPKRRLNPEQIKRRETVAGLMDAGHSGLSIATMLGVDSTTIYADAKALGRSFPLRRPKSRNCPEMEQRRERVGAMARQGKTSAEIQAAEGISESTVFSDLRAMGISLSRSKAALKAWKKPARRSRNPGGQPSPAAAARRAKVPGMIAKGMGTSAIAKALGTTTSVIRHDCRHLGIPTPGKAQQQMKEAA